MKYYQEQQDKIRYQINKYIFENGYAPEVKDLSAIMHVSEKEIEKGLDELAANHALVLHPASYKIWVAHPFALFPTLFWVKTSKKSWWGNCTWCSFGIAAAIKKDAEIYTKMKGEEETIILSIKDGQLQDADLLVHFPVPAKKFWDNVIYTCANMLVFRSEPEIVEWCERHRVSRGEIVPIQQVWELAQHWYGNYLHPRWTRKTVSEAETIFKQVGLTSDFWRLS